MVFPSERKATTYFAALTRGAEQPQGGANFLGHDTHAVVADAHFQLVAVATNFQLHSAGLGMADHVGQTFLTNAEDSQRELLVRNQPSQVDIQLVLQAGPAANVLNQPRSILRAVNCCPSSS